MSAGRDSTGDDGQFLNPVEKYSTEGDQASTPGRDALDQILQETLDALAEEKVTPDEVAALRNVAAKYQNQALNVAPITVELVQALLKMRGPADQLGPDAYATISREIAECLTEFPSAKQRLSHLWKQLQESLP